MTDEYLKGIMEHKSPEEAAADKVIDYQERSLFLNRLRSLLNINGSLLADTLTEEEQRDFVKEPFRYLCNKADQRQIIAIWREIEKRQ